jgi:hypothetical protein
LTTVGLSLAASSEKEPWVDGLKAAGVRATVGVTGAEVAGISPAGDFVQCRPVETPKPNEKQVAAINARVVDVKCRFCHDCESFLSI